MRLKEKIRRKVFNVFKEEIIRFTLPITPMETFAANVHYIDMESVSSSAEYDNRSVFFEDDRGYEVFKKRVISDSRKAILEDIIKRGFLETETIKDEIRDVTIFRHQLFIGKKNI